MHRFGGPPFGFYRGSDNRHFAWAGAAPVGYLRLLTVGWFLPVVPTGNAHVGLGPRVTDGLSV